jgi:hypothetical protein
LAGSHLESQNFAGWLDGPLGVVYALEAARVINSDPTINGAVEVASWCDEEDISANSLAAGLTSAASPRRRSTPPATGPAAEPCGRPCATLVSPPGRA